MTRLDPSPRGRASLFAPLLLAAAIATLLPLGCAQDATPGGQVPVPAAPPAAEPAPTAGNVAAAPSPPAVPVPAAAAERGTILPASTPPEIRDAVEQAKADLAAMKEEIASYLSEGGPVDEATRKQLEEKLKVAEDHLKEIIERAEKAASGGR